MPKKPPNILVFAIDSIRRDHMSCYGYWRLTTPNMDKLAAGGLLFENAFSAYIPTTPAYVSMLTGRDVIATQQVALQALLCAMPYATVLLEAFSATKLVLAVLP